MHLRLEIDRYLRRHPEVKPTLLSEQLSNDRGLIRDLRRGRELKPATEQKLAERMREILEQERPR